MKLSLNWLEKFLSSDGFTAHEIASKLTMGAFEVEEVYLTGPRLQGPILAGKILEVQKHPNADKLFVVKVTTDGKNELQIICGAQNLQAGQMVPVSLDGAIVVNRQNGLELTIKTTKIKGIESQGMLCSPEELGLEAQELDGILILEDKAKLGENVIDYLALKQDTILEVASRSNRGDALSVYGLSREISALVKKSLEEIKFKELKSNKQTESILPKIENLEDTYLFYAVTIEDITICESPYWLKRLLLSVGLRPVNNIVDITNYINFSFGQPLHAYDKAKLKGKTLTSCHARNGDQIVTIDGKTRILNKEVLVIADESSPVAIAGIMGGRDSEVSNSTKAIVLEAAVFNSVKIRRASRSLGLTSEASKRFERGVDSNFTYQALLRAIELVEELAYSKTNKIQIGEIKQAGKPNEKEIKINLLPESVKRVLGVSLSLDDIANLLKPLGFKCSILKNNSLDVLVPSFRKGDITREIDLIEEVARMYSYDLIKEGPPASTIAAKSQANPLQRIKNYLLGCGFSEIFLSSLIGEHILSNKDFPFCEKKAVKMLNPLSKEHSCLRQYLTFGLLETLKLNQSHQSTNVRLFEVGKSYFFQSNTPQEKETRVEETLKLCGLAYGQEENWIIKQNVFPPFFVVKGILEGLFKKFHLSADFVSTKENFLHPSFSLKIIFQNNEIGFLGCLHPMTEKKLELSGPVIIFEFNLEPMLIELIKVRFFEKISSKPVIERDLTIDLSKQYPASAVTSQIKKVISPFVVTVSLISVYELDNETRSLTYRLKMQEFEHTLTSKQADDEINKLKKYLNSCFLAKFRV